MSTKVHHSPASCYGQSRCGKCKPACPYSAIVFCGDKSMNIDETKCLTVCYEEHGKHHKKAPCQIACITQMVEGKKSGSEVALITVIE